VIVPRYNSCATHSSDQADVRYLATGSEENWRTSTSDDAEKNTMMADDAADVVDHVYYAMQMGSTKGTEGQTSELRKRDTE